MKRLAAIALVLAGSFAILPAQAQTLPTPPEVKRSEHTGAGTDGGPAGYTGTGRSGTVGSGPWDGTMNKTPHTPEAGDTPTVPPGPQGSSTHHKKRGH